jgi:hypothetical protein
MIDQDPALYMGPPTGPLTLPAQNRRIIAERTGWPAGAVEMCERVEAEHPPWDLWWIPETMIAGKRWPQGWTATRTDADLPHADEMRPGRPDGISRHPCVYGETLVELLAKMAAMDERVAQDQHQREWMLKQWMAPRR